MDQERINEIRARCESYEKELRDAGGCRANANKARMELEEWAYSDLRHLLAALVENDVRIAALTRERDRAREIVRFSDRVCEFCTHSNDERKKDEESKACGLCDLDYAAERFEWDDGY